MRFRLIGIISLLAALLFSHSVHAQSGTSDNSSETTPNSGFGGFLGKLKEIGGAVVDNMGKRVDINITPAGVTQSTSEPPAASAVAPNVSNTSSDEVYRTLDGSPSKIRDIFHDGNKEEISITKKDMGWPRVAISFTKWGANLSCWQGRADIWTDYKTHAIEDFEACNVRWPLVDALGRKSYFAANTEQMRLFELETVNPIVVAKSTGSTRTAGPNPPSYPLKITIASDQSLETAKISMAVRRILMNVGMYSGFIPEDMGRMNKKDGRFWFYKFELQGRVQ